MEAEADPIIAAASPASRHFSGSPHRRYLSDEGEEEFPNDEVTSTLHNLNGDGFKSTVNNSKPQEASESSYGIGSAEGDPRRQFAKDPVRRFSNSSQGSRRQDSLNPAESEGENTPIGIDLLSEHMTADSPNSRAGSNDDMNYINVKAFQKSTSKRGSKNNKTAAVDLSSYNLPENTIRNRSSTTVEEDRRHFELDKEAFENSKAKHAQSMLEVDETIDTTQSSEQKFLSLEDVKSIFQDVKESRILNCIGDEALDDVDGNGRTRSNNTGFEDQALLGRITSGLRDSLQMLSPAAATTSNSKTNGEIPMEIAIPTQLDGSNGSEGGQPVIDTQVSALEKLEDDIVGRPPAYLQEYQEQQPAPVAAKEPSAPVVATPERAAPTAEQQKDHPLQQMSPFERKVSKVILKQMQDEEEQRLNKERSDLNALRKGINAPENVLQGISFLRKKEKTRKQLEAAEAEERTKKELAEKHAQNVSKINDMLEAGEYVEENESPTAFGTLKKVFTHMYHPTGGNEITLEEYERKVHEDDPPPSPPTQNLEQAIQEDLDVVHERATGKKKSNMFKFWKDSKSKSTKNKENGKKSPTGAKKKSGFFSKRFKKSSSKKGNGEIHAA